MITLLIWHQEKQREELRDDVAYLKSQSMRNNLVFTNIQEDNSTGNETAEITETKLRNHLQEKLKIAKYIADTIRFERVHRSPGQPVSGKIRNIVAKFKYFKDRMVRRQWTLVRNRMPNVRAVPAGSAGKTPETSAENEGRQKRG